MDAARAIGVTRHASAMACARARTSYDLPGVRATITRIGGVGIVELDGEVTASASGRLTSELLAAITSGLATVAVDLSGVSGTDYSLFGSLARAHTATRARGGQLYLVVGDEQMLTALRISGFDRIAPVFFARAYRELLGRPPGERLTVRLGRRERVIDLRDSAHKYRREHLRGLAGGAGGLGDSPA